MKTKLLLLIFIACYSYTLYIALDRTHENTRAIIWSDAEGYYKYLPGLFIIKDFHQLPAGSVWPYVNDKGEYVDKYSCGVAYFELPFFLVGHLINKSKGGDQAADYYNPIYAKAIAIGGVTATFLGTHIFIPCTAKGLFTMDCDVDFSVSLSRNKPFPLYNQGDGDFSRLFLFSLFVFDLSFTSISQRSGMAQ